MTTKKLPQFVLFGDSLTQWGFDESNGGFGWVLQNWYAGKAEIVNAGEAGFTSSMLGGSFRSIVKEAIRPSAPPMLLLTIFLGANDACLIPGQGEYVPLTQFDANISSFVEQILQEEKLVDTKIVLITPPPVNVPDPLEQKDDDSDLGPASAKSAAKKNPKTERSYLTYMSKKRYAEKIMEIAGRYEVSVIGLDLWKALVDAALKDQDRFGEEDAYADERLPGCGLRTAKAFKDGYFTDGLHFGPLAYAVLSRELLNTVLNKWPELNPGQI